MRGIASVAADAAAAAPAWSLGTVLATAAAGAVVALLVDFFLKPRLQVRNEKFSQRAKDQLELLRVVRAIMIQSRLGIMEATREDLPEDVRMQVAAAIELHNESKLDKLRALSVELEEAYAVGGPHLPPPVVRLVEHAGGILQGLLLAGVGMETIERRVVPYFKLLYDVLMTSRFQAFAYRSRIKWVTRVVETGDSVRHLAVLRAYGLAAQK
ncbi:hypothetical protein Arth_1346 [Arthrobacter sp. FB24]|uniref:hypothetical protein n=1 Tax=Arthrobacter sp. (strain FB24) TaxID=290399 RepID=UPI0000527D5A|nr:hypothetical protein [Arthrobacter sp. FB24]ABK02740.1 hypothetical protein Arth_1346 [Arthrobacter sp. FB24]